MAIALHKSSVRKALAPRREPYWAAPLSRGRFIGLRKLDDGSGTWIARYRDTDGRQTYRSLGFATEAFDLDQAKEAAETWFRSRDAGIRCDVLTVGDACRRYVEERETSKSKACSHDAHRRFERVVYGRIHPKTGKVQIPENSLAGRPLAKLRAAQIKSWRDGLGLTPAASNRTLIALKAALNLAVRERNVVATQSQEWIEVKPLPGANRRRDLYLDLSQRQALLSSATGAVRDLLEAAMTTGARPGELVNALRGDYDERLQSIRLSGKTGSRTVPLSPAAVRLFARLSKSKLPGARLLVRDDGMPWAHSDWDELVREAAAKAELPVGVCLYTLRHSFITTALTAGLSTLDTARLVGTSLPMIERHYGHLVQSAARDRLALVQLV